MSARPDQLGEPRTGGAGRRPLARYKFPTRTPLRWFLMSALCGLCGSAEILAWAVLRLPVFFLQGGMILIALGVLLSLRALLFVRRANWTLGLGPDQLTITHGTKQTELPWASVRTVTLRPFRLSIHGPSAPPVRLVLDTRASDPGLLAEMTQEINHRAAAPPAPPSRGTLGHPAR